MGCETSGPTDPSRYDGDGEITCRDAMCPMMRGGVCRKAGPASRTDGRKPVEAEC